MFAKEVRQSFVDAVLAGDAMPDDIDDFIDAWHASSEDIGLAEFLGMTEEEYAVWVEKPDGLSFVLARKTAMGRANERERRR